MDYIKDKFKIFFLALKYWLQGDDWEFAKYYATSIVKWFKK